MCREINIAEFEINATIGERKINKQIRGETDGRYFVKFAFFLLLCAVYVMFLVVQSTQRCVQLSLRVVQLRHTNTTRPAAADRSSNSICIGRIAVPVADG